MPRSLPILTLAALTLILAPAVSAQLQGCDAATPCEWVVDLGPDGFDEAQDLSVSQGDWIQVDFFNFGDEARTVRLEGYGHTWTIAGGDSLSTSPFELVTAGEFRLVDEATGDAILLKVFLSDPSDSNPVTEGNGAGGDGDGTTKGSGLPAALALAGLAAAAVALRRRR